VKSLLHLNKYFVKYKYRLIFGIVFIIISNIFGIIPAQLIRKAFDLVGNSIFDLKFLADTPLEGHFTEHLSTMLLIFAGTVLLMYLLKGLFTFLTRQTIIIMSRLIEYDLKNEIYEHYQKLHLGFYKQNNTGDLMNRISEDVSRVRMYLGPGVMYTINLVVLFVMVIATMASINVRLTIFVLAPLPLLSFLIYKVSSVINRKSERVQAQLSTISTLSQETFSGIRVIKSFVKEKFLFQKFDEESELYKTKALSLAKTHSFFLPTMMLLIGLSTTLTIYIGGLEAIKGNITTGNIAEFVYYVNQLTWPVASLGWVTSLIQRAAASQERINEFLHTQPEIVNPTETVTEIKGKIEFKNVSFTYPHTNIQALKNTSFIVNPGETIAIIGRTGSGKSTIANLITRLFDVSSGEILIDDKKISEINLNNLRENIGYVPQEVFLFSDNITNNIAFGEKKLAESPEIIERAAMNAHIHHNIIDFPKGYETLLGERGITLSGGQKQRVSIARAIIKNPKILIFDDCLSAVDTETEEKILNNLKDIMKNKTSIIISHRISSVQNADKIIVLQDGVICESGKHDDLMKLNGVYADIYHQQLSELTEKTQI
jgi:ATP-binding cassette subfamily B multidrug efflux pump